MVYELERMDGQHVLITGGLGFIGSNLAKTCHHLGATVTVYDVEMQDTGANRANIAEIEQEITIINADIRDSDAMNNAVKGKDIIFNCAAQVSHVLSMEDPFLDIDINCNGHITLLEACRKHNPNATIIYTGTRTQTGRTAKPEIDESVQDNPPDVYGAGKLASELYHLIYHKVHGLKTCCVRLTNTYGPRAQITNPKYGVFNWIIGKAVRDEDITVFEPGTQLRDITYVDDVVDALILAAQSDSAIGEVFFTGSGEGKKFIDICESIVRVTNKGRVTLVPWPAERKGIEVGDVTIKYDKIKETLGWEPKTPLDKGLKETIDFYSTRMKKYYTDIVGEQT